MYKTAATMTLPLYDEDVSSWSEFTGVDVTATNGEEIAVVECTAEGFARKGGKTTVTSNTGA